MFPGGRKASILRSSQKSVVSTQVTDQFSPGFKQDGKHDGQDKWSGLNSGRIWTRLRLEVQFAKGETRPGPPRVVPLKWFSIKGNKILRYLQRRGFGRSFCFGYCQHALAYFCFLEQFWSEEMGSGALAISLRFSSHLGFSLHP
nr:uncharacterized protein LOC109185847 [Ipomoea batatas]